MRLIDKDYMIEVCSDCDHHGEPNGCNRPEGTCKVYNMLQDFADELIKYSAIGTVEECRAAMEKYKENRRMNGFITKEIVKESGIELEDENMRYKCIKEMCLPKCDGDGFEILNEYGFVTVGSIWERDDRGNLIGGDVHLDSLDDVSNFGWIEITIDELRENFVPIERNQ